VPEPAKRGTAACERCSLQPNQSCRSGCPSEAHLSGGPDAAGALLREHRRRTRATGLPEAGGARNRVWPVLVSVGRRACQHARMINARLRSCTIACNTVIQDGCMHACSSCNELSQCLPACLCMHLLLQLLPLLLLRLLVRYMRGPLLACMPDTCLLACLGAALGPQHNNSSFSCDRASFVSWKATMSASGELQEPLQAVWPTD